MSFDPATEDGLTRFSVGLDNDMRGRDKSLIDAPMNWESVNALTKIAGTVGTRQAELVTV
jgi:hypothetical protein